MASPLQQFSRNPGPTFAQPQQGALTGQPTTVGGGILGGSVGQPPQQIQPQQQFQQPQQQFGLAGSESALRGGLTGGLNAIQQGTGSALGTLQFGQGVAQGQLQDAIGQSLGLISRGGAGANAQIQQGVSALGGDFSAQAQNVDPLTGQPLFQQAAAGVDRFSGAGLQAQQLQAALSGIGGQAAFDQALLDSPQQQLIRQRQQEALANQSAAFGGLGSGQFQIELQQLGQAQAAQQVQQQIANLSALSGQGLQAAGQAGAFLGQAGQQQGQLASTNAQLGTQANLASAANLLGARRSQADLLGRGAGITAQLAGQGAGIAAQLGGQGAGISAQLAGQGAGFQQQEGLASSGLLSGTGQLVSSGRLQAGRDIAGQIGSTTSQLSQLAAQQGAGLSDIIGAGGINLANIQSQAGLTSAQQQSQLAQLLSNLSTGQGSQLSNLALGAGNAQAQSALAQGQNTTQLIGNLAGAFGISQGLKR